MKEYARGLNSYPLRKTKSIFASVIISIFSSSPFAVQPFFAPPQPSGSLSVKLYPMENVTAQVPTLVTFGMPFTKGSISIGDLAKVRVLKGNTEIPAFVALLTPWRSFNSADTSWVRVARIQINFSFTVTSPRYDSIVVEWGQNTRSKNIAAFTDPRSAWHKVTSGTFGAADGIYEPDVYAVLPKAHLCQGVIKPTRMKPMYDDIPEAREDPATVRNQASFKPFEEMDHSAIDNFYTIINVVEPTIPDSNLCHYRDTSGYECWLYDRSASMFVTYLRSGYFTLLREAVRAAQFYAKHMTSNGFDLKPGGLDPKYCYTECLAYCHWLTGDDTARVKISTVIDAYVKGGVKTRWSPAMNMWTERHTGFKLLAYVMAFQVLGGSYIDTAQSIIRDFIWHQNGAGGKIDSIVGTAASTKVDGGLYHFGSQHDWDWAQDTLGASPWMIVLIADAMLQAYSLSASDSVAHFIRRIGAMEIAASNHKDRENNCNACEYVDLYRPLYSVLFNGKDGQASYEDTEHALEIATTLQWANYFAEGMGVPNPLLRYRADSLYFRTYHCSFLSWIRVGSQTSGLPQFRNGPFRKYGWQHRPSGSISWLHGQAGPFSTSVKKAAVAAPARTELQCRLNKLRRSITFEFFAAGTMGTMPDLYIYELSGKLVAKLKADSRQAYASYFWDARRQGSGIYLARLPYGENMHQKRIFLAK